MRTPLGAAVALAFIAGLVSPVSAVASPTIVAQAAVTQSTITGHVTDSRGNPLSGAAVRIEGAGKTYSLTSAGDGSFQQTVPPGVYTVTVNRGGYQTGQNDVAVTAGSKFDVAISLQESNLSSLRVIGRSSVSSSRAPFNVSESAVSQLPPLEITLRQNNNLTDTVGTMPGVVVQRSFSASPNTNFVVRGAGLQTRVTIDGHPVSSGIQGQWNSNYAAAGIFQDVEVVKGAGLNGALAGESAVGTVNLRTRDFTRTNTAGVQLGMDSYAGGLYNVFADVNFLKDNRASLIVAKSFVGYNGPWDSQFKDRANSPAAVSSFPIGQGVVPSIIGLDQWQGDFSNRYSLEAELAKLRYRFSETSSLTLEYLGLQGQYQPQGGSYAAYVGQMTVQACQNGSTFSGSLSGCSATSQYTAPYTFKNIGGTVDAYTWFPNSFIQNNEPQFSAEFRTSFKNDTILFRPYTHLINRYISGASENLYPGNAGGWYAVTSAANCQVTFVNPTAAAGAKGPCFPVYMNPNSAAYIGSDTTSHGFATTGTAPTCSPTPPYTCFTTKTGIQNDGTTNYGTPFSQPELDRLNGYTFNYTHPVGDNVYTFSYDYRKDFSQSASGDQSTPPAGCQLTIGSGALKIANPNSALGAVGALYQPNCPLATLAISPFTPRSSIGTPPTVSQYGDFALTGTFAFGEKLKVSLGNYFETYKLNAQIEDPAVLDLYAKAGSGAAAPVALVTRSTSYSHYDPHLGLEYRVGRDTSLRANAGSSITQPYPALVSGFGNITIPNAANAGNYTNSIPNFNLKPETTVAYDLGFDQRVHNGGVLSFDLYDLTVHDVFLANTTNLGTIPNICGPNYNGLNPTTFPLCLQTNQINGPLQRSYGAELALYKAPVNGLGYYVSGTLSRTYLDQLPFSIYTANTVTNGVISGNFNISGMQLFGNPYFKSYGQLLYADAHGSLFELGAEVNGSNNYSFGPSYMLWDAAVRVPLGSKKLRLQISAQNLFNLNNGTGLGRSLQSQGNIQPIVYHLPNSTQLLYSGASANINGLTPRSIRFLLDFTP